MQIQVEYVHVCFVSDHECEQVDGGGLEAIISAGIDAAEEVMLCIGITLLGLPCA
jgi:hypothetical protein